MERKGERREMTKKRKTKKENHRNDEQEEERDLHFDCVLHRQGGAGRQRGRERDREDSMRDKGGC